MALAATGSFAHAADEAPASTGFSFALNGQFAGDAGTETAASVGATSARGLTFDATVATTSDAESNGVAIDPRYYSLAVGRQFAAWRLAVSFSAFEDGVQVETQDLGALLEWSGDRGSIALDATVGDADEVVSVSLRNGGSFVTTLTTDRIGVGLSGTVNAGESVTLLAGFRSYDYNTSAERLAARPRLEDFVTNSLFTRQQGIVDSTWYVGASAAIGRVTAGIDFANSDDLNGDGSSQDIRFSLTIPLRGQWSLDLGAGQFDRKGRSAADDGSTYGSVGVRFSSR
jgi:hypothetical protein